MSPWVSVKTTAIASTQGLIHPTINYEFLDPDCDLDYVPNQPRKKDVRLALSTSAGFGGVNGVLLFKRFEETGSL